MVVVWLGDWGVVGLVVMIWWCFVSGVASADGGCGGVVCTAVEVGGDAGDS